MCCVLYLGKKFTAFISTYFFFFFCQQLFKKVCASYSLKCYHLLFLVTYKTRPFCIFVSHLYFIICGLFTICQTLYHLSFMLLLFLLFIFMKSVMGAWSSCMFCISFPILQIWTCLKNFLLLYVVAFFKVQVLWLQELNAEGPFFTTWDKPLRKKVV